MSTLAASPRSSCIMQPSWVTRWMMPFTMGGRHQRKVSLAGSTGAESVRWALMVTLLPRSHIRRMPFTNWFHNVSENSFHQLHVSHVQREF